MNHLELDRSGGGSSLGSSIRGLLDLLLEGGRGRGRGGSDSENLDREGADHVEVDESAAAELGKTNVEEEDGLEGPVEGDPVKDGIAPELNNREGSVDDPVSQEVGVVFGGVGLKSLEGVVARDDKGGKVGEKLSDTANVEEDEEEVEEDKAQNTVGLGDASLSLNLLEDGESLQFLETMVSKLDVLVGADKLNCHELGHRRKKKKFGRKKNLPYQRS